LPDYPTSEQFHAWVYHVLGMCEDDENWVASANVTVADDTDNKEGTYSKRFDIADAFTTGIAASYELPEEIDLSDAQKVYFWVKSNITASNVYIRLEYKGVLKQSIHAGDLTAGEWKFVETTLGAVGKVDTLKLSISVDAGAQSVWLDEIFALEPIGVIQRVRGGNEQQIVNVAGTGQRELVDQYVGQVRPRATVTFIPRRMLYYNKFCWATPHTRHDLLWHDGKEYYRLKSALVNTARVRIPFGQPVTIEAELRGCDLVKHEGEVSEMKHTGLLLTHNNLIAMYVGTESRYRKVFTNVEFSIDHRVEYVEAGRSGEFKPLSVQSFSLVAEGSIRALREPSLQISDSVQVVNKDIKLTLRDYQTETSYADYEYKFSNARLRIVNLEVEVGRLIAEAITFTAYQLSLTT